MTKIKICGLRRIEDIDYVNKARPEYIGFVFAESPRRVDYDKARQLRARLDNNIAAVGVFVNEEPSFITGLCRENIIDMVQLHGDEDQYYIALLKNQVKTPVIKAIRVKSTPQILAADKLPADYLLLDTYQKDIYGGSGRYFDWSLIPPLNKPFFLAGGLNASNIEKAASHRPYCLDVSSGVETDGKKDPEKILEIIKIIRGENK